ncbi:MAG: HD domain-containing protein [Desulfohalobiaceae bacterium]
MMHRDSFPARPFQAQNLGIVPSDQECYRLWDEYQMLEHIRIHSELVALVAAELARLLQAKGLDPDPQSFRAAGLLHDLAKTYTLRYRGNHCQIGAVWVLEHTHNPALAQGVLHHVYWPGELDLEKHTLPLCLIYADKRVMHDRVVPLSERFDDLRQRYGSTRARLLMMQESFAQVRDIEGLLNSELEVELNAYPFDSRRVVQ